MNFRLLLLSFLILSQQSILNGQQMTEYYRRGIDLLNAGDTTAAENNFYESAKRFSDIPSYYELAKINNNKGTIWGLNKGRQHLKKIIDRDENNIEYKLLYAEMNERAYELNVFDRDGRERAIDIYKDIIAIDSMHYKANFQIAKLKEEDFYEFFNTYQKSEQTASISYTEFNSKIFHNYLYNKFIEENAPLFSFSEEAMKDFREAEKCYKRILKVQPGNKSVKMNLAMMYENTGMPDEGIKILKNLFSNNTLDSDFCLMTGLLYYQSGNMDSAFIQFQRAIALMDYKQKKDFTFYSVIQIITPMLEETIGNMTKRDIEHYIKTYWETKDPLKLTDYNERLLEHYYRVAYANLRFEIPGKKIPGWRTDRGEMMLRYGHPLERKRFRSSYTIKDGVASSGPITKGGIINMKTEVWNYPDFTLGFTDMFDTENYVFNEPSWKGSLFSSQYGGDTKLQVEQGLRKSKPEQYTPKFQGPVFDVPYYPTQFKDLQSSATVVHINYTIEPIDSISIEDQLNHNYKVGLFLFDKYFNRQFERKEITQLIVNNLQRSIQTINMTTKPDSGNLAFEMIREYDNGVASYHGKFKVNDFSGEDLMLSDIIVASDVRVSEDTNYPVKRNEYSILPNPSKQFDKSIPVYVYYEIYNLAKDKNRLTDYDQKITIRKTDDDGSIIDDLLNVVGIDRDGRQVSLSTNYKTLESEQQIYLQLDMSGNDEGEYMVEISITDKITGNEVHTNSIISWK